MQYVTIHFSPWWSSRQVSTNLLKIAMKIQFTWLPHYTFYGLYFSSLTIKETLGTSKNRCYRESLNLYLRLLNPGKL